MSKPLEKLTAKTVPAVRLMLWRRQGGKCPLCGKPISVSVTGQGSDYALDHCHESGEVRALLHRSCNSAEGKVLAAAGSWGAKSMKYEDVVPFVKRLVEYWEECQNGTRSTGMMYPSHKTPEQKKEIARVKRNTAAAVRRAKERVKNVK